MHSFKMIWLTSVCKNSLDTSQSGIFPLSIFENQNVVHRWTFLSFKISIKDMAFVEYKRPLYKLETLQYHPLVSMLTFHNSSFFNLF